MINNVLFILVSKGINPLIFSVSPNLIADDSLFLTTLVPIILK